MILRAAWRRPGVRSSLGGFLSAALALPLLGYHFAWDQGVYAAIADAMLRGGIAYRDGWEFRPPGGFYAYYLSFLLFGRTETSVRILEVVAVGLSGAGLVRLAERRFSSTAAGLAAAGALAFLHLPFGHWDTAQPESYQMPFLVWALALWPREDERERLYRRCGAAGLLLGAAITVKTPAALTALVLLADRLRMDRFRPDAMGLLGPTAATAAGVVAPSLAVAAYYAARGAFEPFYDAVFVFAPSYVRMYGTFSPFYHAGRLGETVLGVLPAWGPALVLLGVLRGMVLRRAGTLWWGALAAAAAAQMALQQKYIPYHAHLLTPFLALGVGMAFAGAGPWFPRPGAPRAQRAWAASAWLAAALGGLALADSVRRVAPAWEDLGRPPERRRFHRGRCGPYRARAAELARAIRRVTSPGERIFLWANDPLPYFLSDRPMAGPYPHLYAVVAPWLGERRVFQLLERLERDKPRLVVVGAGDSLWTSADGRTELERHPPMREYLKARYRRIEGWEAYEFWLRASDEEHPPRGP